MAALPVATFADTFTPGTSPSCTISVSPTVITSGQAVTLSYSSSNTFPTNHSAAFSISGIGAVMGNTSGSVSLTPTVTTTYTGTAMQPNDLQYMEDHVIANCAPLGCPATTWGMLSLPSTNGEFLSLLYYAYYGRVPDSGGYNYWLTNFTNQTSIEQSFGLSGEAKTDNPFLASPSSSGINTFLVTLYSRIVDRAPDSSGYSFWNTELTNDLATLNSGGLVDIERFPLLAAQGSKGSIDGHEVESGTCSVTVMVTLPASCTFNGSTVANGNSITAWQSSTVPYGSTCTSQSRVCTNGVLSGSYAYSSCSVNPPSPLPPSPPTATISADQSTITLGRSANITANFTAGSNDTLIGDNIDSPLGTGIAANTNPITPKNYVFTPTAVGIYTFYAVPQTQYYGWYSTNAPQTTVTVNGCTPSTQWACTDSTHTANTGNIIASTTEAANCAQSVAYTTCGLNGSFCSPGNSVCEYPLMNVNAHLTAIPSLVPYGASTNVKWDVSNATCSVTDSMNDSWSGSSGSIFPSIYTATTFTLHCTAPNGDTLNETRTVNLVPKWTEI